MRRTDINERRQIVVVRRLSESKGMLVRYIFLPSRHTRQGGRTESTEIVAIAGISRDNRIERKGWGGEEHYIYAIGPGIIV
jgi:hypothetical protein